MCPKKYQSDYYITKTGKDLGATVWTWESIPHTPSRSHKCPSIHISNNVKESWTAQLTGWIFLASYLEACEEDWVSYKVLVGVSLQTHYRGKSKQCIHWIFVFPAIYSISLLLKLWHSLNMWYNCYLTLINTVLFTLKSMGSIYSWNLTAYSLDFKENYQQWQPEPAESTHEIENLPLQEYVRGCLRRWRKRHLLSGQYNVSGENWVSLFPVK